MSSRSAPTATTVAPYDGSALASRSAWRLVPPPETSTTSRQSDPAGTRTGYLEPRADSPPPACAPPDHRLRALAVRAPLPPGSDHPGDQTTEAHRSHRG